MTQDSVVIFDTTLRDGEQSPGATMTHAEKLEIAEMLDDMGVDIIEAAPGKMIKPIKISCCLRVIRKIISQVNIPEFHKFFI